MIETYFRHINELIAHTPIVGASSVTYDKRSPYIGFIRASLYFVDGTVLHFREFVNVQQGSERYMYVYQYQRADGTLIFRYDNTPHFPDLPSFPHHKHQGSEVNVMTATPPDLGSVLAEIHSLMIV